MKTEMKFHFAMKKIMFTLLFTSSEMKENFVSELVGVKWPIKNVRKPERDIGKYIGGINSGNLVKNFYVKSTQ